MGTHYGSVIVIDFAGTVVSQHDLHSTTVNEISICSSGDYVASCSTDGKVVVFSLFDGEIKEFFYHRPVKTVAIEPNYTPKSKEQFVSGGMAGQLILSTKGWRGNKDVVLHQGEGPIHAIRWEGSLIAWANDTGVKMYDVSTGERITFIGRPEGAPRADLYKCCLVWENPMSLLIAWGNYVQIATVKSRPRQEQQVGAPKKYAEISSYFSTKYFISGIAPQFHSDDLVILAPALQQQQPPPVEQVSAAPSKTQDGQTEPVGALKGFPPQLRIISRRNVERASPDAIRVHGFEHYNPTDYRLEFVAREQMFYIVSPKDVVMAQPRNVDDNIQWLVKQKKYELAYQKAVAAEPNEVSSATLEKAGTHYLHHLVGKKEYGEAANLLPLVAGNSGKQWKFWIYRFFREKQLRLIAHLIPTDDPRLEDTTYQLVLIEFLQFDTEKLKDTVKNWLENGIIGKEMKKVLLTAITRRNSKNAEEQLPVDPYLLDTLISIHTSEGQFDLALSICLELRKDTVFELIEKHALHAKILKDIPNLMKFDHVRTVELLKRNTQHLPVTEVVKVLNGNKEAQYQYLHAIISEDSQLIKDYEDLLIELYADFDRPQLRKFLVQYRNWDLDKALDVCQSRGLVEESVTVLKKVGNYRRALELILLELHNVPMAVEFLQEVRDDEEWDYLIATASKSAEMIGDLLDAVGGEVDPIRLIRAIPENLHIEGLRDKLVHIISDYRLQMGILERYNIVLLSDCVTLQESLVRESSRALELHERAACQLCGDPLVGEELQLRHAVVFHCRHFYHVACLERQIPLDVNVVSEVPGIDWQSLDPATGMVQLLDNYAPTLQAELSAKWNIWCPICENEKQHHRSPGKANARGQVRKAVD